VTVNEKTTARHEEFFQAKLAVNNSAGPVFEEVHPPCPLIERMDSSGSLPGPITTRHKHLGNLLPLHMPMIGSSCSELNAGHQ